MKILGEVFEDTALDIIYEEVANGGKTWKVSGVIMQAEIVNRNGRIYPKSILEREVLRYNNEKVSKGRALGELDHPEGPSVNLKNVSHRFIKLEANGNDFVGEAIILDTPAGMVAQGLLKGGTQLGISSRGMGTIKEVVGKKIVQEDFYLSTAGDLVSDPSAYNAWLNGLYESVEYFWNADGTVHSQKIAEIAKAEVEEAVRSRTLDNEKKAIIFEKYLNSLVK